MSKSILVSLLAVACLINSFPLLGAIFTDKENGFTIDFPEDWEYKEKMNGTDVMCFSPQEGMTDKFRENLSVSHEDLSSIKSLTLDKYVELSEANMKKVVTDYKRLSLVDKKIGGIPAKEFIYTFKMGNYTIKGRLCLLIKGGTGYIITGTATDSTFDKYQKQFNKIFDSIKIIPKEKVKAGPAQSEVVNGRYINKKYKFSIDIPKEWESKDDVNGRIMFLFTPLELNDNFRENINIGNEKIPSGMSNDAYMKLSATNMKKVLNKFKNLGETKLKINGLPARRLNYAFTMGEFKIKGITFIVFKKGESFIISCGMLDSTYDKYEKIMTKTAESFKIDK